jgi:hypothetical protein
MRCLLLGLRTAASMVRKGMRLCGYMLRCVHAAGKLVKERVGAFVHKLDSVRAKRKLSD